MTSNLGSASVFEMTGDKQQARDMVMMAVRSHFRPEFINRVDEFIMFDPLEQEQIKAIVRLQVRCVSLAACLSMLACPAAVCLRLCGRVCQYSLVVLA